MDHPGSEFESTNESAREALSLESQEINTASGNKESIPTLDPGSDWTLNTDLLNEHWVTEFKDWSRSQGFFERTPANVYGPVPARKEDPLANYNLKNLDKPPIDPDLFKDRRGERLGRLGKFQLNPNGEREVELKVLNDCDGVCLSFEF